MSDAIGRREARRRLYYLMAVCGRQEAAYRTLALDFPTTFGVSGPTFAAWLALQEPIPLWVVSLAQRLYKIPPPPVRRWPLVAGIVGTVLAGAAALLLLSRGG